MKNYRVISENIQTVIREINYELYGDNREATPPLNKALYELVKRKTKPYGLDPIHIIRIMGHRDITIPEKMKKLTT